MATAVPSSCLCKHCYKKRNCVVMHTSTQSPTVVSVFTQANMLFCPQPGGISLCLSLVSRVPRRCLFSSSVSILLGAAYRSLLASPILTHFCIPPLSPIAPSFADSSPQNSSPFLWTAPNSVLCVQYITLIFLLLQLRHGESPAAVQAYGCGTVQPTHTL